MEAKSLAETEIVDVNKLMVGVLTLALGSLLSAAPKKPAAPTTHDEAKAEAKTEAKTTAKRHRAKKHNQDQAAKPSDAQKQ
ncbi:MAG: hypothetical protein R2762_07640 [Bryobacteraceae bacterium]